jgi:preprotein translocase subunit SecY
MEKSCNGCGTENISKVTMSSADWQKNEQRHERREKRLVWVIVLLIVLLVGSNVGWLIYESQFETVETNETIVEATQDGEGVNIVGGGDVNYGTESKNN